jgi:dCTP diphosphatase
VSEAARVFPLRQEEADAAARRLDSLAAIAERLRAFRDERDWQQFHTPLNLAVSLSVECGELLEQFQWTDGDPTRTRIESHGERIREELADVVIYAIQLADVLDFPLGEAIDSKIELNARHYPPERARGSSRKYSDLHDVDQSPAAERH